MSASAASNKNMNDLIKDIKKFYRDCMDQDFGFYMVVAYLVFSNLRPQAIYPALDILPWTQLCIVAGLVYSGMQKQLRFQRSHFAILMFFLATLVSSFFSQYQGYSLERLDFVYIWLVEALFFTSCIKNIKQFRLATIVFFILLFKISLFGARTWVERGFGFRDYGIAGPHGFYENSGELSLLMVMLAVMSIAFLAGQKEARKTYYVLPLTAIMTVLAASSRGGQLALVVGLIVMSVYSGKLKLKNLLIMIVAGWLIYTVIPDEQKERFREAGEDNTSQSRLLYWEKGLEMLEEYPLLGVGHAAFPLYFEDHYSDLLPEDAAYSARREVAHNTLVQVASSMGYIGLVMFLWMYWVVFSLNRQTRKLIKMHKDILSVGWIRHYSKGLDVAMVTFFVGSFFMSVAYYPYIYFMLMFSQAMKNSVEKEINENNK